MRSVCVCYVMPDGSQKLKSSLGPAAHCFSESRSFFEGFFSVNFLSFVSLQLQSESAEAE